MEQYPVQFFTSFLENLQRLCRDNVNFSQFVEIHGYLCVEIDDVKKERYVLSELLQSSGNMVSESYCTKSFSTGRNGHHQTDTRSQFERTDWESQSYSHSKVGSEEWTSQGNWESKFQPKRSRRHSHEDLETCASTSSRHVDNFKPLMLPSPRSPESTLVSCREGLQSHATSWEAEDGDGRMQTDSLTTLSPSFTDTAASPTVDPDDVIDLDMIDDDVDSSFVGEETSVTVPQGVAQDQPCSTIQQRKTRLSPGTLNVIKHSVKQFKRFHFDKSRTDIDLLSTPPDRLNILLYEYFKDAKKIGGGELTARSLKNVQAHLEMFLRDGGYPYSVSKDKQFQSSRDFLKKKLMDSGKIVTQKFSPVDNHDIETMFYMNQLGSYNRDCLTNTMWFLNSKYFAIRRPAEHFGLKWGCISLKTDDAGQEYLERKINESFSLKVFAQPETPNQCFVNFYKTYKSMRPKIAQDEEFSFYLKVNKSDNEQWFLPEAMAWNPFTTIWRKLVLGSGLPMNKKIM
ncbi:uncharacterized protein LOC124149187 isoform X3 [Haliotis rufescens]|uniref:uncharacterized protein LOC124149187 isoform X3 n=1 Tax=Haliotis rufescens TaxID=6454 RepID=UPI00201F8622|nr:uncharacterized protein LOC124149187 isoform X3 [Haliotis rufescens]